MGRIILLNGGSSSGKSTIAAILHESLDGDWLRTGLDHWLEHATPPGFHSISTSSQSSDADGLVWVMPTGSPPVTELRLGSWGLRLLGGVYEAYAGLVRSGLNVIIDDVLFDRRLLSSAVVALADLSVLFVGVRCPAGIAASREAARGDRVLGLASLLAEAVHDHATYDIEFNTSQLRPAECAALIGARVAEGPAPTAFRALEARVSTTDEAAADPVTVGPECD